jgi:hypothetical protein
MKVMTGALNAALAVALVLYVNPANAQAVKNGGPTGTVVSASVPAPPGSTPIVYTTPATGFFLLTTACFPVVSFGISASGFGRIPASDFCVHYSPGLALPQNSTLTCNYSCAGCTSSGVTCTIAGVLTRR